MATIEYSRGQNVTIEPFPKELIYFSLAKEFGWLPSQIDNEPSKKIEGILTVLSTYNSAKSNEIQKGNRQKSLGMTGAGGKQYIDITDPKVEEQLKQGKLRI